MELKSLIAPDYHGLGLSCRNCANLALEYDLEEGGAGVWVCDHIPEGTDFMSFPFMYDMPCFELSFWHSIFARNLSIDDDLGCEAAFEDFKSSLALLGREMSDYRYGSCKDAEQPIHVGNNELPRSPEDEPSPGPLY